MRYRLSDIDSYIKAKSVYVEYVRFEDDAKVRAATKRDFMAGLVNAPKYRYPRLDRLSELDNPRAFLQKEEHEAREALKLLEAQRENANLTKTEYDWYVGFYGNRLNKMMLVEAASRMRCAKTADEQRAAREEFMMLNRELYGEVDTEAFGAIMASEQSRVDAFTARNDRAEAIRRSLEGYFIMHRFSGDEAPLIAGDVMADLRAVIAARYADILSAVPETDEHITYDAEQSRAILQAALDRGGLSDKGWTIEVHAAKSNPATNADAKKIYLPTETRRTAAQLRRLIVHEIEVHARRGQNGADSGIVMLEKGTADYADVEEGLGVLLECVVAGNFDNQSYHRARDRYLTAGVALGVDGSPKDGRATFGLIWRLLALRMAHDGVVTQAIEREAKVLAMQHTENAFRGTNFAMPGVIYAKLKVYYEGLVKNAQYFTRHADVLPTALDQALLGKYDHVSSEEAQNVVQLVAQKRTVANV